MSKYLVDYHTHTHFSFDSEETIAGIRKQAALRGLEEVGIADHFTVNPQDKSYGLYPYDEAQADYLKYSRGPGPLVRFGLEIGEGQYLKDELDIFLKQANYDFIIGSVHNIGHRTIRQTIRRQGLDRTYTAYYDELLLLAREANYDVLGHLDLVNRYTWDEQGVYRLDAYIPKIEAILEAVICRGKAIEVNTSGLYKNYRQLMPHPWIIRRYCELGGELITLGSDAHSAQKVGDGLVEAQNMLIDCGFKALACYEQRKVELRPII